MDKILLGSAIAFVITFAAIPIIIQVANTKKLFDHPDERKIHILPIPSLGGLGIFAGFVLASLFTISFSNTPDFQYFFAAALVIFFLGLKDDILVISPMKKFIGQVIAAFLIVYKGGLVINSMHGFLGVNELPEFFSLAFTYLTIIVIVNSFNLIDGVDGLAGSLGLMTSLVFGVYFYMIGEVEYATLAFCLTGSLIAFLIFNHSPAKIFMGDTGSLLIGLVNAILVIRFINVADSPASTIPISASPAIGFAILIVPLFDTLRVFSLRILSRRSPFSPDRNHIHHLLMDHDLSHSQITYACVGINIFFIGLAYLCRDMNCTFLIVLLVSLISLITGVLFYTRKRKAALEQLPLEEATTLTSKILQLKKKSFIHPEQN
ncbi:MAG TPA: MraY family glycosyltransferase [Chitinophagaceae bacterium]|jgi:UDP-GlcNAc:undecaprenyl-phosphate/decaprenyl-phosphate GlcNAc-1-phosphate transferase|nr:MraY family glycosyltransferase [Chitinophagaceae bacterium]